MSTEFTDSAGALADANREGGDNFATLFDRHRSHLERMIRLRMDSRLRSRVDPNDVLQETYLTASKKFERFLSDSELPFLVWIRLETGQKLVETHRRHLGVKMRDAGQEVSLHRGGYPSVESITLAAQLLGRVSTASKAVMRTELKLKVQHALNEMDARDREVLVLRHFEDLGNTEVALTLGISPTAACNRHVRALRRLKQVFQDMPGGLESIGL